MSEQPKPTNYEIVRPSVKFRGITKPYIEEYPDIQTAEQAIAYHARVSNPRNQGNPSIKQLINYCIKQGHWSIFEQASITLEIVTSRDISAQIVRHNLKMQEASQRYAEVTQFLPIEAREQDTKNRQNSIEINNDSENSIWLEENYHKVLNVAIAVYQEALDRGIAKEVARKLLPINAKTTISATWNIRDIMFYIDTRTKPDTQKEHREIAEMVKVIFIEQFPIISECKGWK